MIILDGRKLKNEISLFLKKEIDGLRFLGKKTPKLVIIQIGDISASNVYIKQKLSFADKIGVFAELLKFPEIVSQSEIINKISELNNNDDVHGVIVQLPVPNNLDQTQILNSIDDKKDIDGLGSMNLSKLIRNDSSGLVPATSKGIISLLKSYDLGISNKNIVVIGRSVLVGKTLSLALINQDATVTVCHSHTLELSKIIKNADIVISAVGKPGIINDGNVHEKQIIVDVGISKNDKGVICGDVFLDKKTVYAVSPVPGGVGQMTVASLFQNLLEAYRNQE